RTRIDQLAQKDLSRNLLNLLPTLVIFILMFSTYLVEIAGIGVPRQRERFGQYDEKIIDWSMFNTPTWDATYLLENLLDQFTSGIQFPNEPLFNVTPKIPPTYWRLGTHGVYEYHEKTYTTRWAAFAPVKSETLSPGQEGGVGERGIPVSERTATFKFELPLDYSTSVADVSVNINFRNYLPTTWNGKYGAYIDSDSFRLYDENRNSLSVSDLEAQDVYPDNYRVVEEHLLGIDADIRMSETSSNEGVFEYTADYYDLLESNMDAMTYSMTKDNYSDILIPLNGYSSGTWADIQELYLQLPNTTEELPTSAYVGGETRSPQNYADWAPFVAGNASECELEGLSVFAQAYADMQRLTPIGVEYQGQQELCSEGVTCSDLGLLFDVDMWIGTYVNELLPSGIDNPYYEEDYEMPHPEENEDYNEWFLRRGKGVSLHFASTLATWMRLRGIPSRVVIGYLFGNHTMDPTRLVVTAQNLHAWTEVLIPIDPSPSSTVTGDEYVEWIGFDPLLTCLAARADQELTFDIPSISPLNSTWMINPEWDYINQDPLDAFIHDLAFPDDPVMWRVNTTDDDRILRQDEQLNVSVRLMMLTSPNSWIPWQPTCDYTDFEVEFYIGTAAENGSIPGSLIEEQGIYLDNSTINSAGLATIHITYDVTVHGFDDLYFYAVFTVTTECGDPFRRVARSRLHQVSLI
ncbi:MAG: transglutaminase domain-containing protein, partial [Thermoplasmata archaeon]